MQEGVVSKIEQIALRVTESEGMELVEVEVKGGGNQRLVRIWIDKPAGITHGDCELVSQQVGTILDVEDVVPGGRYTLEVSSPGVERKLLKPADYLRFQGKKVKVTLRDTIEGRSPGSRRARPLSKSNPGKPSAFRWIRSRRPT